MVTNFHSVLDEDKMELVSANDLLVEFLYDGQRRKTVMSQVERIMHLRSRNTRLNYENRNASLEYLDYAVLELKPSVNDINEAIHEVDKEITIGGFHMDESSPVEKLSGDDMLVLVCVGHPDSYARCISLGELKADPQTTGNVNEKDEVNHTCPTCPGSSGSPIFALPIQKTRDGHYRVPENCMYDVTSMDMPCFIHYSQLDSDIGCAMTCRSIIPDMRRKSWR